LSWHTSPLAEERTRFTECNRDVIPDYRYYPRYLSLSEPFKFAELLS